MSSSSAFQSSILATTIYVAAFAFTFIALLDIAHGSSDQSTIDAHLLTEKIGTNRTIIVDVDGKGDFNSVQAAIDSVPIGNPNWVVIHLGKGIYREKVSIQADKPNIFLRGKGKGKTAIVWSHSSVDNTESATFKVEAPHFIAFGISFKNEAPTGIAHISHNQSVATLVGGDMVAFYHCAFFSTHNTLFDSKGRHYYDNCYIQGSIDFIFGRAQSIFYNCEVFVIANRKLEIHGSVTAHHRPTATESSGFVFIKGKVFGFGDVYLGSSKEAYSRVVFANTYISKTVIPKGWTNWRYTGSTENLYQAEYKCHGPGSAPERRALWSKQLTDKEVAPFLSIDFINGKDWLPAWF